MPKRRDVCIYTQCVENELRTGKQQNNNIRAFHKKLSSLKYTAEFFFHYAVTKE